MYLATEFSKGGNLGELIEDIKLGKKPPLSDDEIVRIICHILLAISYIHNKDIVHRDLKLENILVFPISDSFNLYKLCDFGISRDIKINATGYHHAIKHLVICLNLNYFSGF
jgi:serine/threonine protein kinase